MLFLRVWRSGTGERPAEWSANASDALAGVAVGQQRDQAAALVGHRVPVAVEERVGGGAQARFEDLPHPGQERVAAARRADQACTRPIITLDVVTGSAIGDVAVCATGDATAAARWTGAVLTVLATCVLSAQTLVHERAHPQPARD
ncbi:hypothetical protein [Nonomuraea sp. NPDC049607]|uniref:hypothetical protein n=1 Tax=Nonomuraea sp. NPDC049607 TaxID=3154732 RepID=UPI00342E0575